MRPDLGQHLRRSLPAARARTLVLMPVYPRTIAEAPGSTVGVTFGHYLGGSSGDGGATEP